MREPKPIESGDVIKHEASMDVCLDVEFAFDRGDGWLVTGYWVNQGMEKSWYIPYFRSAKSRGMGLPDTQTFLIKYADLKKWLKVKMPPKDKNCYRKCEWEKVA